MFKYILTLCFVPFLFLGCNKNSPEYSVREYKDISKDAILNAAKRVIKLSDKDFTISAKKESINAIRAIPKNKGFTVDININELELTTASKNNYTTARLKITQRDDIFSNNQRNITMQLEDLFWNRVDYILGINKDWYTCTKHRILLNFDGFFCDIKYNTNTYPSSADIIKDISIPKPKVIAEDLAVPIVIDLSSMDGIVLPFDKTIKDTEIKIADINLSVMSEINGTNIPNMAQEDINKSLQVAKQEYLVPNIDDKLNTINDNNSTYETNATNELLPNRDTNKTIVANIIMETQDNNKTVMPNNIVETPDNNISENQTINENVDNNQSNIISAQMDLNATETSNQLNIGSQDSTIPMLIDINDTTNFEEIKIDQDKNATTNIIDSNVSTSNLKNDTKKSKPKKSISKLNIVIEKNSDKIGKLTGFPKKFMEADTNNDYTINLALAASKMESDLLIKKFNIKKETFPIGFRNETGKYFVKIMYGIYNSRDEALEAIAKFPKELKLSSPTVEGVHRKQILFNTKGEDLSDK